MYVYLTQDLVIPEYHITLQALTRVKVDSEGVAEFGLYHFDIFTDEYKYEN